MIFAAGLGTRLKPLTNNRPKALVEVNGKSLLEHNILKLKYSGFDHIVVNVHHFGNQIIEFLKAHDNFGIDIKISDERNLLLDTGGGIKKGINLFENNDPILIHNVDIISTLDLNSLYKAHLENEAKGAKTTLCVSYRDTSRYLLFSDDNHMQGWTNIKTGEIKPNTLNLKSDEGQIVNVTNSNTDGEYTLQKYAFSGIHVVSQSLAKDLNNISAEVFPIMDFYISTCSQNIYQAYEMPDGTKWVDCGKPESLVKAAEILKG